jgi:hypothetical protein
MKRTVLSGVLAWVAVRFASAGTCVSSVAVRLSSMAYKTPSFGVDVELSVAASGVQFVSGGVVASETLSSAAAKATKVLLRRTVAKRVMTIRFLFFNFYPLLATYESAVYLAPSTRTTRLFLRTIQLNPLNFKGM